MVQEKYLLLRLFWKIILALYKIKDLKRRKIIEFFYEKELLLSILSKIYYPEPDIHIRDKVNIVSDLSNYDTEKNYYMLKLLKKILLL